MGKQYFVLKHTMDFLLSFICILFLSPFLIVIALWIKLDSPGPALFRQERIGKHLQPFTIYKFRTMVVDAEKLGRQITIGRDPRITRCGMFLRTYKLDELPQLFNILRGDMSFVGPRPEVPRYVDLYNAKQKQVFLVRPGLTDEASIKYRNENQLLEDAENAEQLYIRRIMPDKLQMNLSYIQNANFKMDIEIIIQTFLAILKKTQTSSRSRR